MGNSSRVLRVVVCGPQAHTLLFLLVYAVILILPYTKWRDRLPAKPSFYRYIVVLVVINLLAALGACEHHRAGQETFHQPLPKLHVQHCAAGWMHLADPALSHAGAILLGSGVEAGYCVYGLASFLYYSIYPPVCAPHVSTTLAEMRGVPECTFCPF